MRDEVIRPAELIEQRQIAQCLGLRETTRGELREQVLGKRHLNGGLALAQLRLDQRIERIDEAVIDLEQKGITQPLAVLVPVCAQVRATGTLQALDACGKQWRNGVEPVAMSRPRVPGLHPAHEPLHCDIGLAEGVAENALRDEREELAVLRAEAGARAACLGGRHIQ